MVETKVRDFLKTRKSSFVCRPSQLVDIDWMREEGREEGGKERRICYY